MTTYMSLAICSGYAINFTPMIEHLYRVRSALSLISNIFLSSIQWQAVHLIPGHLVIFHKKINCLVEGVSDQCSDWKEATFSEQIIEHSAMFVVA